MYGCVTSQEPKPVAPSAQSAVFCEDKQEQVQSGYAYEAPIYAPLFILPCCCKITWPGTMGLSLVHSHFSLRMHRTLFAKIFFERLAAEQTKQVEASPRRGKLFGRWKGGGGESKPHPSPAQGGGVESGSNNTMPLHHFISKFKSKHTVL